MTYRAPIPVGPEDEEWTDTLSAKKAFDRAVVALTDSSLALQKAEEVVDEPELKAVVRSVRDDRHSSLRKLREMGLAAGFRADDVDASGTESLRRSWMTIKSKVTGDAAILTVLIDEEASAADNLKEARSHALPHSIDNAIGSAVGQIENDIEILRKNHSNL